MGLSTDPAASRRGAGFLRWLIAVPILLPAAVCGEGLRLDLSRLDHPLVTLEGVTLSVGSEGEPARLAIVSARLGGYALGGVDLACPRLQLAGDLVRCHGGTLDLPRLFGRVSIDIDFDASRAALQVDLATPNRERLHLGLLPDGSFNVELASADIARLSSWVPALDGHRVHGRLSASARGRGPVDSAAITFDARLSDAGFATAGGLNAAEALGLTLSGRFERASGRWEWSADAHWTGGEAYVHPLYLTAGASLRADGRFDGTRISVDDARLEIDGAQDLALHADVALDPLRILSAAVEVTGADLAVVAPRYLIPLVAPAMGERLKVGGRISAGGRYESGRLTALDVSFDEVTSSLDGGLFGVGPLSGVLPWRAFESGLARVDVGGANWEELTLGGFRLEAHVHGNAVDFEQLSVPVLDGRLVVSELSLERRVDGWHGQGGAFVEPLTMERLTAAVGLPSMSGVLSAALPALVVRPGSLSLDGTLVISVFDGYVRVSRLELREPLGVAAYLTADLEARNLDLGQITDTFAFGHVTGFIDADVLGLELVRWRPVAFDATVRSSPGRYARRISQRAVQNIGALGGGGAVMALQRGVLGFFESFGYRDLGLSCRLSEGVCVMGGIAGQTTGSGDGFVIVRGGGIPSLNVIGYNRRVDWPELLARLQAAIASNNGPVIE